MVMMLRRTETVMEDLHLMAEMSCLPPRKYLLRVQASEREKRMKLEREVETLQQLLKHFQLREKSFHFEKK